MAKTKILICTSLVILSCWVSVKNVYASDLKSLGASCMASSECQSGCCSFGSSFGSGACRDASICGASSAVVDSNYFDTSACQNDGDACSRIDGNLGSCEYDSNNTQWNCVVASGQLPSDPAKTGQLPSDPAGPAMNGVDIPTNTGLSGASVKDILSNLLMWLLEIVGVIAIIGFVISGIQYILSSGEEDRMKTAKRNMIYSIMGIVVVLASFVIIQAIDFALRGYGNF